MKKNSFYLSSNNKLSDVIKSDLSLELSELHDFINQSPLGLIRANKWGKIIMLNAFGSQIITPIAIALKQSPTNILDIIGAIEPELKEQIVTYKENHGTICDNRVLSVNHVGTHTLYISFIIKKIAVNTFLYAFLDYTETHNSEQEVKELNEQSALDAGRLEMATGILHDIGNVVMAFGTEVSKLRNMQKWTEIKEIQKLIALIEAKKYAIDSSIGDRKAEALLSFLSAMTKSLEQKKILLNTAVDKLYNTTSHVQEILNIQRHYVAGKESGKRTEVKLENLINDSFSIQQKSLTKRNILFVKDIDNSIPTIQVDKTKLIQVFINLLRNAIEAFDEVVDDRKRIIKVMATYLEDDRIIQLIFIDNAIGFDSQIGHVLFERGNTSKVTGTGFGLNNCKEIIESHHGSITIESQGKQLGAKVIILFYLSKLKNEHL